MQITLNVDTEALGNSIQDIFNNMSQEKKEDLAASIIHKWMELPYQFERDHFKAQLIEKYKKVRQENPSKQYYGTVEEDYEFKRELEKFKSTREEFLKRIIELGSSQIEKASLELIQKDTLFKEVLDATLKTVQEQYPQMVQKAFAVAMQDHFNNLMSNQITTWNTMSSLVHHVQQQIQHRAY